MHIAMEIHIQVDIHINYLEVKFTKNLISLYFSRFPKLGSVIDL